MRAPNLIPQLGFAGLLLTGAACGEDEPSTGDGTGTCSTMACDGGTATGSSNGSSGTTTSAGGSNGTPTTGSDASATTTAGTGTSGATSDEVTEASLNAQRDAYFDTACSRYEECSVADPATEYEGAWTCDEDSSQGHGLDWLATQSADDPQACAEALDLIWDCYLNWYPTAPCSDFRADGIGAATEPWVCQSLYDDADEKCGGITLLIEPPPM